MNSLAFVILLLGVGVQLDNAKAQTYICNQYCDRRDPSTISDGATVVANSSINGRLIKLIISDLDNMGYASIEGGSAGDELWMDRSFDGGLTWDQGSLLGFTQIPNGESFATTLMYNVDHDAVRGLGALRACGRGLQVMGYHCYLLVLNSIYYFALTASSRPLDLYRVGQVQRPFGDSNPCGCNRPNAVP